jgi:hypothetical protein
MIGRQPAHAPAFLGMPEEPEDQLGVAHQVPVGEDHSLRDGRGAGGVLKQGDRFGLDRAGLPAAGQVGGDITRRHDPQPG